MPWALLAKLKPAAVVVAEEEATLVVAVTMVAAITAGGTMAASTTVAILLGTLITKPISTPIRQNHDRVWLRLSKNIEAQ